MGTYSSVWAPPHLFKLELFDTGLVWRDSGTFDTNAMFQDSVCGINSDLVVCLDNLDQPGLQENFSRRTLSLYSKPRS